MNQNLIQLLAAMNQPQQAAAAPQVNGVSITGAIVQFENSEPRIGDVALRAVPDRVEWTVAKTRAGVEYLRSKHEFSAIAHIGEHGRVWGTDVADTGMVAQNASSTNSSFKDRLAAVKGTVADETAEDPL